ncbi:MAG: hypothetical protein CMN21_01110 [Rubinisphaera sp.]|nr:hypothetical protein [Rubinisphaera sp.]
MNNHGFVENLAGQALPDLHLIQLSDGHLRIKKTHRCRFSLETGAMKLITVTNQKKIEPERSVFCLYS